MIVVPFGSGQAYRNAPVWQDFNIVEEGFLLEIDEETARFSWQAHDDAEGYQLRLYADEEMQNELITYDLDIDGQLQLRSATTDKMLSFSVPYSFEKGVRYYYELVVLGSEGSKLSSSIGNFTLLGDVETSLSEISQINTPLIPVAYYSLSGAKLSEAPASGFYIVVYDNGTAEKIWRK